MTYSHKLLVAFIVSPDGYALPVACEFIENPGESYDKQDCETKAFHQLGEAAGGCSPRRPSGSCWTPSTRTATSWPSARPTAGTSRSPSRRATCPALWREAQALLALEPGNLARATLPAKAGGCSLEVRWVGGLDYHGLALSAVFQAERDRDGNPLKFFAHLTLRPVDRDNCPRPRRRRAAALALRERGLQHAQERRLRSGARVQPE